MNPLLGKLVSLFRGKSTDSGESPVEKKIRLALKERAAHQKTGTLPSPASPSTPPSAGLPKSFSTRPNKVSLNTIALKFPKADHAFREIRKKFDFYDKDQSQSIDVEELKECLKELQVALTEAEIQQLFKEADMDSSDGVQFKEFILLMAIVHLLYPADTDSGARFGLQEVEDAFNMVEDAFLFFDEDGDGYLSKDEIHHALTSGKEGMAGAAATQRFAEMDYNTDGLCSFKEFLYAYVGWVGTAEEEDEEDEAGDGTEAQAQAPQKTESQGEAPAAAQPEQEQKEASDTHTKKKVGFQ